MSIVKVLIKIRGKYAMAISKVRRPTLSIIDAVQGDGNQELELANYCDRFVISCKSAGTGTLKFSVKMVEDGDWEYIYDSDTNLQQEIDLDSNTLSFVFDGWAYSLRVEPDTVSTTYSVYIQQGTL